MLSNLKSKLFKSIKSKKLNVFGFFLLLSFLFLVFSKLSKTYTETLTFHIKYENVPEQYSIDSNSDSIINVKVKTYGFNLLPHNFYRHTIAIDFEKEVQKYEKKYVWDIKKGLSKIEAQLGSKIEVLDVQPDSLSFPYEIMYVKRVPVKLDAEISYAPGYDILDSIKISPDSVNVIGPKNKVQKISKIRTAKFIQKNTNKSIKNEVELVIDKSLDNVKLSANKIKLTGTVEKFTEGTFEVPVNIINLPSDIKINYFPKTIVVAYYVSLDNYKEIKALDFKINCDYNEAITQGRTYFTPELVSKPQLIKSAKMKQSKVEFIIIE